MVRAAGLNRKGARTTPMIEVHIPGSKSITNRALIAAALANGKSLLFGALESDDTAVMIRALKELGVKIQKEKRGLTVYGGQFQKPARRIFCGNSGTTARFLAAVLAAQNFTSIVDGDARMKQRPIEDLVDALRSLGAKISYLGKNGFPPIKIERPIQGGKCTVEGKTSSQFLSGLLLAAPLAEKKISIRVKGKLVSAPYVLLTLDMLKKFGVRVEQKTLAHFEIQPNQEFKPRKFAIEGDASAASYFWGISALTGEPVKIANLPKNSIQADAIPAKAGIYEQIINRFTGTTIVNCTTFPDSAMTLAVLAAFRKGKTRLTGLENLRVKECDRLHALATELRKIGARVKEFSDGLEIIGRPKNLHPARIKTYNDHRMAMCFGMLGVVLPGIKIENPKCVKKTYPQFWHDLEKVKNALREKNIILTGMRGSGKSKLGAALGRFLGRRFIDIDELIEEIAGRPIASLVEKKGWKYFRMIEKRAVEKTARLRGAVIATGGGTLMNAKNEKIMKTNGKIIFLHAAPKTLRSHLGGKTNRPSLTGKKDFLEELEEVYEQRKKRYNALADAVIDVSKTTHDKKKDLQEKLEKILSVIKRWGIL